MLEKFIKSRKSNLGSPMGRAVTGASVIGLHMVVAVFIGFGMGYFLDKFLGSGPWLTGIFLLLGIIAGFKNMISQGKKLLAVQEEMDKERYERELAEIMAAVEPLKSANSPEKTSGPKILDADALTGAAHYRDRQRTLPKSQNKQND